MRHLVAIFSLIALFATSADTACAQDRAADAQAKANSAKARRYVSALDFPAPEPTDEIREAYPHAYIPRLVRLADGNLVLSVIRWGGMAGPAYWLVYLDGNGAPVRQIVATIDDDAGPDPPVLARDGGFLLVGHDRELALATRIDRDGRELWTREFPDFYLSGGWYVGAVATADDGFVLAGSTTGGQIGRGTAFLVERIDRNGNTLWKRMIGKLGRGGTWLVAGTPDGDIMLYGAHKLLRLDPHGRPRWQAAMCCIHAIVPSPDGSVVVGGGHYSGLFKEVEPFMARIDRGGRLLWRRLGRPPDAAGSSIVIQAMTAAPDGGVFMLLKHHWPPPHDKTVAFSTVAVARYAADGKLLWWRTVVGAAEPYNERSNELEDAASLPNGQVLITALHHQRGRLWLRVLPLD